MVVIHKATKQPYSAVLERVPITTPRATYNEWYVRLRQIDGIKSDMCPYTDAVKRYIFPKSKI